MGRRARKREQNMNYLKQLVCPKCSASYARGQVHGLCSCGSPLLAAYDLEKAAREFPRASLAGRPATMWRYREMLPVQDSANIVSLGEGFTPLVHAQRLGTHLGLDRLYIKEEAANPTGSFKARGLCAAVSMAKELGIRKLAIPSAGNAAGAMAAYAAHAGLESYIFMPEDTPRANVREAEVFGAHVTLVQGLITDCGRIVSERKEREGWFDVSTLKEPYRIEGKKTMGYELAEQFGWELPDVILYPTGGGTGLIGMWRSFREMEALGWIGGARPRMVSVQSSGCAPIVRAFEHGARVAEPWQNARTIASGLRVPRVIGDFLILEALYRSLGTAEAADDQELVDAIRLCGKLEGIFLCPEAAACVPVLRRLVGKGWVSEAEKVVLFNTASGLKYLDVLA
jgi:threonine synthase